MAKSIKGGAGSKTVKRGKIEPKKKPRGMGGKPKRSKREA